MLFREPTAGGARLFFGADVNEDAQHAEAELIQGALEGDSSAFEQLVFRHQNHLYNAMVYVIGCRVEAEDVCQDAFVQAYVKLESYRGSCPFYSWLYRIAFNTAMTRLRKKRPELSLDAKAEATGDEPTNESEDVGENLFREERSQQIHTALQTLNEDFRSVLVLRDMEGESYEDIAQILDMPIGTVRSRIHRARSMMREKLKPMLREMLDG